MAAAPLGHSFGAYEEKPDLDFVTFTPVSASTQLVPQGKAIIAAPTALVSNCSNVMSNKAALTGKVEAKVQEVNCTSQASAKKDGGVEKFDNNTDSDDEVTDEAGPLLYSDVVPACNHHQRKQADHNAFSSWLANNRDDITKATKKTAGPLRDEDRTSAAIVRDFESAKIIESPRDYQIELFEKAKQKNIIAVLDTGTLYKP